MTALKLPEGARGWAGELQRLRNAAETTVGGLLSLLLTKGWGEHEFHAEKLKVIRREGRGRFTEPPATGGRGVPKMGTESEKNKDTIAGQRAHLPSGWGKLFGWGWDANYPRAFPNCQDLDLQAAVVQKGCRLGEGFPNGCRGPLLGAVRPGHDAANCELGARGFEGEVPVTAL